MEYILTSASPVLLIWPILDPFAFPIICIISMLLRWNRKEPYLFHCGNCNRDRLLRYCYSGGGNQSVISRSWFRWNCSCQFEFFCLKIWKLTVDTSSPDSRRNSKSRKHTRNYVHLINKLTDPPGMEATANFGLSSRHRLPNSTSKSLFLWVQRRAKRDRKKYLDVVINVTIESGVLWWKRRKPDKFQFSVKRLRFSHWKSKGAGKFWFFTMHFMLVRKVLWACFLQSKEPLMFWESGSLVSSQNTPLLITSITGSIAPLLRWPLSAHAFLFLDKQISCWWK